MTPAGTRVVDAAKADGSWTLLDSVEAGEEPPELAAALDETPHARQHWDAFPRGVKRSILGWVAQAKRTETRARRIAETAERAGRGERANQWVPRDRREARLP